MTDSLAPADIVASLGGNEALARQAATAFLQEAPRLLSRIAQALAAGDADAIARAAHTLKSAVGNFPAPTAVEAAHRLEARARSGDLREARADIAALEDALRSVSEALAALVRR